MLPLFLWHQNWAFIEYGLAEVMSTIAGSSAHNRGGLVSPASLADGLVWMVWAIHCTRYWWTLNLHKALCKLSFCKIFLTTYSWMYGTGELLQGHHREQPAMGHFTLLTIWGCVQQVKHVRLCLCCKAIVVKVRQCEAFCCKAPWSLCNGSLEWYFPLYNGTDQNLVFQSYLQELPSLCLGFLRSADVNDCLRADIIPLS